MSIVSVLLPEFDHEMATTRRVLERVPAHAFDWKPHEKSMSLGELCAHLANIPAWCSAVLELEGVDLSIDGDRYRSTFPQSPEGLIKDFEGKLAAARAKLVQQTDPELKARWTLKNGGHEVFTLPRITAIRSFILNHSIHHRGQLTVYLRLNNVALPPVYGPTADEQ